MAASRTAGQAAKAYRLLRTVLAEATHDGIIAFNPCTIKGAGADNTPERPQPTMEMIGVIVEKLNDRYRLNDHYRNKVSDKRYEALVWTAALSGLREGELFALERQDVNILQRTISVTKQAQKIGSNRREVSPPKSPADNRVVTIPQPRYWPFLLNLSPDRRSPTIQAQPGLNVGPFHWDNGRLRVLQLRRLFTFSDDLTFEAGQSKPRSATRWRPCLPSKWRGISPPPSPS